MLSEKAISILADVVGKEVIDELAISEEFIAFLHDYVPSRIEAKLGECDDDLLFDLSLLVMDRVALTLIER